MKKLLLIIGLLILFWGCEKNNVYKSSGKSIDFYRLSDYETLDNSFKIIESTVRLSDVKIISYSDIISYNRKTYTFIVSDSISDHLTDFENYPIHGTPFALTLENEIIYTGYFWAGFSSMSCDWITIDPIDYSGENKLIVKLGYPGLVIGDTIPDKRNDDKIIDVLLRDGKLIN